MTPAQRKIKRYREDPVYFATDCLRVEEIDDWQLEVLRSFPSQDESNKRQAMQACVGPGKSTVLAWCGLNFLSTYGDIGEHPKGAAVSITAENLSDNLWAEYSKWMGRSQYLSRAFTWTHSRIYANDHPETWFMSARSFPKTADSERIGTTLSGLHAKYVLMQIDESGDIPPAILKAAEQALSSCKWGKIQQAGNPSSLEGVLYTAVKEQPHLWQVIRVTGDPDDPHRSKRIDRSWAIEQIENHGRDNPWVMFSVLGLFPPASINALLGPDDVSKAMRQVPPHDSYAYSQKRLGMDVARFGDDASVLFPRQGLMAYAPVELRGMRNDALAARLTKAKADWGSEVEFIDSTGGYGAGVIDFCIQGGISPIGVNNSESSTDPKYFNKRSEIHFLMAEWVKRGGSLPQDPDLARQLVAPTYTFFKGKLRVEEKDMVKKKLKGKSPDKSDALSLTFAWPEMPGSLRHLAGLSDERGKLLSEWEPGEERG